MQTTITARDIENLWGTIGSSRMLLASKCSKAHAAGVRAKSNGWSDASPFYEDSLSDAFFARGYSGMPFAEALEQLPVFAGLRR